MEGGSDHDAGDEEDREDGDESSARQEGIQGSHDRHSCVLRGTLYGENRRRDFSVPACLYLFCGQPERCLNPDLSVAVRGPRRLCSPRDTAVTAARKNENGPPRGVSRPVPSATNGRHQAARTFTGATWADFVVLKPKLAREQRDVR